MSKAHSPKEATVGPGKKRQPPAVLGARGGFGYTADAPAPVGKTEKGKKRKKKSPEQEPWLKRHFVISGVLGLVGGSVLTLLVQGVGSSLIQRYIDPAFSDAHIAASQVATVIDAGKAPSATFTVLNSGSGAAEDCHIDWKPGTWWPHDGGLEHALSNSFALKPNEAISIKLTAQRPYEGQGATYSIANVKCRNTASDKGVLQQVIVMPSPNESTRDVRVPTPLPTGYGKPGCFDIPNCP